MSEKTGKALLENKISFVLPIALSSTGRDDKDHQRMLLLLESFEAFFNLEHLDQFFIVCPPANKALIERLLGNRIQKLKMVILDENSLCPEFINDPDTSISWPKLNKGWYRQQLIKLAIYERVRTTFYMTLDADVIFCRHFGLEDLILDGKARLNVQDEEVYQSLYKKNAVRNEVAVRVRRYQDVERILQCTRKEENNSHWYGETPVLLSQKLVFELVSYIEMLWKKPWRNVLLENLPWNEYPLYFLFAEEKQKLLQFYHMGSESTILRLASCLWLQGKRYNKERNINHWQGICEMHKADEGVAVVVQSYLGYPIDEVADIARVVFGFNSGSARFRMFFRKIKRKLFSLFR